MRQLRQMPNDSGLIPKVQVLRILSGQAKGLEAEKSMIHLFSRR
jgi:hypothetical protein